MKKEKTLKTIGWIIIILEWLNLLWQAFAYELIALAIGLIFMPFVAVPIALISYLFTSLWGLVDILLVALAVYWIVKYSD
ncbi:MAG: hypothetical protein WC215_05415 [Bacilli bacterium]